MKWVIRISSHVHLLVSAILLILCFSFSGVLARNPEFIKVYVSGNPAFADPGEDPHLRVDIVTQPAGNQQSSSGCDSADAVPVSISGEKTGCISRRYILAYKFRFALYSMFGIYFH